MTIFTAADLAGLVEPDDVCLDIGAGTGRHTVRMGACVGLFGHVHAVEARPLRRLVLRVRTWAWIQVTAVEPVAGWTVDGYCERAGIERVAVIRLAVARPEVLAGAAEVLRRDRPLLLVDRPPGPAAAAELRRAGYRVHRRHAHSRAYLPASSVRGLPERGTA